MLRPGFEGKELRIAIFGCGYVGRRVAALRRSKGDEIQALTRSVARADELRQCGIEPLIQDLATGWTLPPELSVDAALYCVGFDRQSVQSMEDVYLGGVRHAIAHLPAGIPLVYLSTTGVYGPSDGEWLNETASCAPRREGARWSLAAEEQLRDSHLSQSLVILRSAGIYGPDRLPNLQALQENRVLEVDERSWLNLIHVDDLVAYISRLLETRPPSTLYNVSDGSPVLRRDYYRYLGERLGLPEPRFQQAADEPIGAVVTRRGSRESKRIDSGLIREEIPLPLRYPTYRQGIDALIPT